MLKGRLSRLFRAAPFSRAKDLYHALGVSRDADSATIKKAYVRLARELHPDRNPAPNAKERFAEVAEAYQTLSDAAKRRVYDGGAAGAEASRQPTGPPSAHDYADFFGGAQNASRHSAFKDFADFFASGGETGARATRVARGADLLVSLELEFMEAVTGTTREVSYKLIDTCATCKGAKTQPGTSETVCPGCAGVGTATRRQGPIVVQTSCTVCGGTGSVLPSPCTLCRGRGVIHRVHTERVGVPRGIAHGQSLRVAGKGNAGENGGPPGDLLVSVTVKPDAYFRREDCNVFSELGLNVAQAALGVEVNVRTLHGMRRLSIPAGTNHGSLVRLPNEGVPKLAPYENERGDHYVVVNVLMPRRLSVEQRALYEQLRNLDEKAKKA